MKSNSVKKLCLCAMCIALCVVLPKAFALIPNGGKLFSPMHIPVLLCGIACGSGWGALCGLLGPLLGALTGTPPILMAIRMIPELVVFGLAGGLAMANLRTGSAAADTWLSLAIAMVLGRIAGCLFSVILEAILTGVFSWQLYLASYTVEAVPAMILHLAVIPVLVFALSRARLIPARYPKVEDHG